MTKQALPVLLILMMLITPIISAFEQCSSMDMSAHFSENQNLAVTISTNDASLLKHKIRLKGQQINQADIDCYSGSGCTFHVCTADGIGSSALTVNIVNASYYSNFEYIPPDSTALSPNLRPPILIL